MAVFLNPILIILSVLSVQRFFVTESGCSFFLRKVLLNLATANMVVFKSIIVFDTETTSLPEFDHHTTRITEVAFIGCEIQHLKDSEGLPRVLHKLVLVFNPNKAIQPGASRVSGLTNELVVNVQPLREEDVDMVRHFISRLPPPVCVVAHNGDNFDFPILRRAIEKLNKSLQNNIYCADSIKAFRSLLKTEPPLWTRRSTPKHSNEVTPTRQTRAVNTLHSRAVCRELFPDDEALSNWASKEDDGDGHLINSSFNSVLKSYRLKDVYFFFFGGHFPDAHRAEEDSKALLSCIKRCEGFFNWMNENAVIFNSIQPLF